MVARLTHPGFGASLLTPLCVHDARRVTHEIRTSVLVARAVFVFLCWCAFILPSDSCGTSSTVDTQVLGARHVVHEMQNVSVGRTCSVCAQVLVCFTLAFLLPNDSHSILSVLGKGMDGRSKVDVCSSPTRLSAALAVIALGVTVSGAEGLTDERELARTVFRAALILCAPRCLSRRAAFLWLLHLHDGVLMC